MSQKQNHGQIISHTPSIFLTQNRDANVCFIIHDCRLGACQKFNGSTRLSHTCVPSLYPSAHYLAPTAQSQADASRAALTAEETKLNEQIALTGKAETARILLASELDATTRQLRYGAGRLVSNDTNDSDPLKQRYGGRMNSNMMANQPNSDMLVG